MFCPNCGTYNPDEAKVCISCQSALNSAASAGTEAVVYAGFFDRLAALLVDVFVLMFASGLVLAGAFFLTAIMGNRHGAASMIILLLAYLVIILLSLNYFVSMEAGEKGATLGKRMMKIRVVDMSGNRISKLRALGRWLAHGITNMTMYIGYIMQPFTAKKQALHDMIAGTQVIRTSRQGSSTAVVVVVVAGLLFFFFMVVGILAAVAIPAYQGYIVKAQLSTAEREGRLATLAVESYYRKTGQIPATLAQAHLPIRPNGAIGSVTVNPKNAIVKLTFVNGPLAGSLAGKSLVFTPSQAANGRITWKCSSPDIKRHNLLPKDCR